MSEADARTILEAARESIRKAQESGGIEEIPLAEGRAFVKARREPDPDEPSRMAPGFVLISFSENDLEDLIRETATGILDGVPAVGVESDLDAVGWKRLDLGGAISLPTNTKPSSKPSLKLVLIGGILALFACYWFAFQPAGQSPTSEADEPSNFQEKRWATARFHIKNLLQNDWARRRLTKGLSGQESDRDLLIRFSQLFRRSDIADFTRGQIDGRRSSATSGKIFDAFLNRFPEQLPSPDAGHSDLTATQAMQYLGKMLDELKKRGLEFELENLELLEDKVRLSLDFAEFARRWQDGFTVGDRGN